MKKITKIMILAMAAAFLFCGDAAVHSSRKSKSKATANETMTAQQAVLLDCETNECLFEKNADEQCTPSSMTKLMTLYIIFSEIKAGRLKMEDEFPVSEEAQKMTGSKSFFQAGTMANVEDLIRSIIVHSGNDACIVIAEGLAGSVEAFAEKMNDQAKVFGLKNTHFMNPTGMPEEDHFSSVNDIAIIAHKIITDFPEYYHYFSEKTFTINSITQQNRNTLLGNALKVDGLKTGKTDAGGYGIVVSAKNYGKRLIAVINGCKNAKSRAKDANRLLALGFKEFSSVKIAEAGKPITEIPVWLGIKDTIRLCTHEDIAASVSRKYLPLLKIEVHINKQAEAPVALGTKLGELVYKYGSITSQRYDLFAYEAIGQVSFLERIKLFLQRLIFGQWNDKEKNDQKNSTSSNQNNDQNNGQNDDQKNNSLTTESSIESPIEIKIVQKAETE